MQRLSVITIVIVHFIARFSFTQQPCLPFLYVFGCQDKEAISKRIFEVYISIMLLMMLLLTLPPPQLLLLLVLLVVVLLVVGCCCLW